MTIGSKPDFSRAYTRANEILVSSKVISKFPFSTIKLIKEQSHIQCRKFSKAEDYNVDIEAFGSKSAVAIEDENKRIIIFYNQDHVPGRVKFSTLHEYGHVELKHDFSIKDNETYNKYEVETNYFSAQLLMPEQILREFQKRGQYIDKAFLIKTFGVSEVAAEKRMENLFKVTWNRSQEEKEYDDIILQKYMSWINSIVPPRFDYLFEDEEERQREREQWKYNRNY